MEKYIKQWARLIKESMDEEKVSFEAASQELYGQDSNKAYQDIVDLFKDETFMKCSVVDENMLEFKLDTVVDDEQAEHNILSEFYEKLDEVNDKLYEWGLRINDEKISHENVNVVGDEDNPKSYKGLNITIDADIVVWDKEKYLKKEIA